MHKVKDLILRIFIIVDELIRNHTWAESSYYTDNLSHVAWRLKYYVEPRIEELERIVGKKLEKCWKAYEDVLFWVNQNSIEATKESIIALAKYVMLEPFE